MFYHLLILPTRETMLRIENVSNHFVLFVDKMTVSNEIIPKENKSEQLVLICWKCLKDNYQPSDYESRAQIMMPIFWGHHA